MIYKTAIKADGNHVNTDKRITLEIICTEDDALPIVKVLTDTVHALFDSRGQEREDHVLVDKQNYYPMVKPTDGKSN